MMKQKLLMLLSIFFFFGCSHYALHHSEETLANFSGKKTFAWLGEDSPSDDVRVNNPAIRKLVHASVERELIRKGYLLAAREDADFLLTWFGSVDDVVREMQVSAHANYGYGFLVGSTPGSAEEGVVKRVYTVGTLILDIIDPQSKTVFWRESATNAMSKKMSKTELAKYIDLSVAKILKGVPAADH